MKNKKVVICILIAVIIIACFAIGINLLGGHTHSFGEWETKTPADCVSAEVEVRKCECGEEETREGDPATGHNMQTAYDENGHWTACGNEGCDEATEKTAHVAQSISAVSNMENPMADMVVKASDLTVTAACACGEHFVITDGIELEGAALVLGENTVTVKYGELSTTLTIQAAKLELTLDGTVSDDTYVSSSSGTKDNEYTGRNELGTNSSSFRAYFRVNVSDILNQEYFAANEDDAKVQLILAVTSGTVTEDTTFTLKAYDPGAADTNAVFSELTWNNVDNKNGSVGTYSPLHWSNGTVLVSGGVGHNVAVKDGCITITLAYRQIADYVDDSGNILFAFATNTSGLKIGSLENETEANRPAFRVVLNDEHFHVFDRKTADRKYLISANCGERATYYKSCSCGEAGTETFGYGGVIPHSYISISAESKLANPMATMVVRTSDIRVTATCACGARLTVTDGIQLENATLALGKNTVIVRYGNLSTKLVIETEAQGMILDGTVCDDTYVSSSSGTKDKEYSGRNELGTNSSSFRAYFRVNVSDILSNDVFKSNKDDAKVQLILAVTSGTVTEDTTFTLKAYAPAAGVTDVDFSAITWNSINNKAGAEGAYKQLNWSNGTALVSSGVSQNVAVKNGCITITLTYSQIADYVDDSGNILFAFATNTSGLKVGSLENETKSNRPVVQVILNGEHLHVFDQEVAEEKYLASANYGEKAKYYKSCTCGEIGTETFEYGEVITHSIVSISAESKLENPTAGMVVQAGDLSVTAACGVCGERFTIIDGIELEGAALIAGKNTITVRYGELSTTVTIEVAAASTVLDGTVSDDTYVFSSSKDGAYADKTDMGTKSDLYRVYFRVNVSDILENELFAASDAKAQLILSVTAGEITDETTFTLKAYTPAAGVTDVDFSAITWNSVNNKEGSVGAYSKLNWGEGAELSPAVSVENGKITLTLAYSEIEDYVDANGNIVFAFATNTKNLKVGSLENETEANRPAFQVVISGAPATHEHAYGEWETKTPATCTDDEVQVRKCGCGQEETQTVAGSALGHNMVTRYDAENHWTACDREGCDYATAPVAHSGGTATETEKAVCEGCGQPYGGLAHEHSFSEWETQTPATCSDPEIEVRSCECGETETREGDPATGNHNLVNQSDDTHHWSVCDNEGCNYATEPVAHAYTSLSAASTLENPMAGTEIQASDLAVTAVCECGKSIDVTDGIQLENATLAFGENTVTVKYGELSTTITIKAAKIFDGTVSDDTYVSSSGTTSDNSQKTEMGTNSSSFRVYFRVNVSDILNDGLCLANTDDAKAQLILTVTSGNVTDTTTFTLKAYAPAEGVTDVDFSALTWKSVNNKEGSVGAYSQLNWNNGTALTPTVSVNDGKITLTLAYSEIANYVDGDGNILLAFATNTSGLKVGSLENEANEPSFKVVLSDKCFHVSEIDEGVDATCTETGLTEGKHCSVCSTVLAAQEIIPALGHTEVVDEAKAATCTETGLTEGKHCSVCNEVIIEQVETAKVAHTYNDENGYADKCAVCGTARPECTHEETILVPGKAATCEEAGTTDGSTCKKCGEIVIAQQTIPALEHDMKTNFDENGHWTECDREGCDEATAPEAHYGGTATENEHAICEGCGQPYGALKQPESTKVTVSGTILDDTYVDSGNKKADNSSKTVLNMRTKDSNYYRSYFRFDFNDILVADGFTANSANATVQFTFAVTEGTIDDTTTFQYRVFNVGETVTSIDFSDINWNSIAAGGAYESIGFNSSSAVKLIDKKTMSAAGITYENGVITITVNYSDIANYLHEGKGLFVLTTSSEGLKVASMENTSYAAPTVSVTYTK